MSNKSTTTTNQFNSNNLSSSTSTSTSSTSTTTPSPNITQTTTTSTTKKKTWFYAGPQYNYDIRRKLLTEGCGQIKRNFIQCKTRNREAIKLCQQAEHQLKKCKVFYDYLTKKKGNNTNTMNDDNDDS